ncbi:energy-coupled thiamine transporter ThiT [Acutalibacter sp. 1XD8-36]|uniref:energy-coupled thiamine transporter ThiT n=1 Tax=Acutalibacter sp. 1XD8-36 TaxID=2320852 RepID=UPI0026285D2E|nr:energy-coupled thiamine transporter ThiT [Acutalibacter sp. 1XD8-36]
MNNTSNTRPKNVENLVLAGVLVALGTALSFVKVFDLPYGGSITLCSMLPVMLFSYRAGIKWGLGAGFTFSVLELLFGLDALKGISGATVAGSIFLDYLLAFTVLGLAGIFRGKIKHDPAAFTLGCLIAGLLRYACSILSGWLLWAQFMEVSYMREIVAVFFPGLSTVSGPQLGMIYSTCYNGMYMIPEILVTCIVAFIAMQLLGRFILKD